VIIAASGLAQKVGTAALLFLFFFKMAGPIGALLVAGLAFVLVHTFYEFKTKRPDELPDLPDVDRELRESLHDFSGLLAESSGCVSGLLSGRSAA
jgi:hypothetical protein